MYAIYILAQRKEVNDLLEFVVIRVTTSSHANNGIHGSNSSYWGLFINCKERGQHKYLEHKICIKIILASIVQNKIKIICNILLLDY